MKKTYTLVWDEMVETLTADELLARMDGVKANGWHVEECNSWFDFMVCFW